MRTARKTLPGAALLTASAWASSMPSASLSLWIMLLRLQVVGGQLHEVGAAVGPRLAAVEAAHGAADLQRGVDLVGRPAHDADPHHPAGERHLQLARAGLRLASRVQVSPPSSLRKTPTGEVPA